MKTILGVISAILMVGFGCSSGNRGTSPGDGPDLSHLQLSMVKFGGWIDTSTLDIYESGWARAKNNPQGSPSAMDSGMVEMTELEQQEIDTLLDAFPDFESAYAPEHYLTDQEDYYLICHTCQPPDTTSLYDLSEVIIPDELRQGIRTLEQIWERAIPE